MRGRKTGGGSRRGRPNKATQSARELFQALVDGNAHRIQGWLDAVEEEQGPALALKLFIEVADFCVPRLSRAEQPQAPAPTSNAGEVAALIGQSNEIEAAALYESLMSGVDIDVEALRGRVAARTPVPPLPPPESPPSAPSQPESAGEAPAALPSPPPASAAAPEAPNAATCDAQSDTPSKPERRPVLIDAKTETIADLKAWERAGRPEPPSLEEQQLAAQRARERRAAEQRKANEERVERENAIAREQASIRAERERAELAANGGGL
jgi:hypothetical protein